MLQGLIVVVVVPLLALPAGLSVWRLPVSSARLATGVGLAAGAF
jgi:hypothetical protein